LFQVQRCTFESHPLFGLMPKGLSQSLPEMTGRQGPGTHWIFEAKWPVAQRCEEVIVTLAVADFLVCVQRKAPLLNPLEPAGATAGTRLIVFGPTAQQFT
jgi:hypothetical protein